MIQVGCSQGQGEGEKQRSWGFSSFFFSFCRVPQRELQTPPLARQNGRKITNGDILGHVCVCGICRICLCGVRRSIPLNDKMKENGGNGEAGVETTNKRTRRFCSKGAQQLARRAPPPFLFAPAQLLLCQLYPPNPVPLLPPPSKVGTK